MLIRIVRSVLAAALLFTCVLTAKADVPKGNAAEDPNALMIEPIPVEELTALTEDLPEGAFSIVWIPDTQNMTLKAFAPVEAIADWTREHRENHNILIAVHTGDIVSAGGTNQSWQRILPSLEHIRESVPLMTAAGNHDVGTRGVQYDYYLKWRPDSPLPEEQLFRDGAGSYRIVETQLGKLLIVTMGSFNIQDEDVYEWLNEVFHSQPDAYGILVTHDYLVRNAELSSTGGYLFDRVVKTCPSLKLVLCGHNNEYENRITELDDDGDGTPDRTVLQMMMNYQFDDKHTGYFRILTFMPDRSILVDTYSAYLDRHNYYPNDPNECFAVRNAF